MAERVQKLIDSWEDFSFPGDFNAFMLAMSEIRGISVEAMLESGGFIDTLRTNNVLTRASDDSKQTTAVESSRDSQIAREGTSTPRTTDESDLAQALIFREQARNDVLLRAGQEAFPGSINTSLGNRTLPRLENNFNFIDPIRNFFNTNPSNSNLSDRFQDFVTGPRVTGSQLGADLERIISSGSPTAIEEAFTNQSANATAFNAIRPAFEAAVAPFLQTLGSGRRANALQGLQRRFESSVAANPQNFSTPSQVFDFFSDLIPQSTGSGPFAGFRTR